MADARGFFEEQFGASPASVVVAPGRLELLGNHTDYNQGLVMSLAIDRHIQMAAAPRSDRQIELVSTAFPQRERFSPDTLEHNPAAPWADYVKGVLAQLRRRGLQLGGFNAAIHGTIPLGAGLSSSAALEVATALTLRQLFPFTLHSEAATPVAPGSGSPEIPELSGPEMLALAKLCQAAENEFVGVKCGLLDQISSLFGRGAHAIKIDCRDLTVDLIPFKPEAAIVVCNSGVKHALVAGEYNERRQQCESAARRLGVSSLRAIEATRLAASHHCLSEREYQCARHIVGENQRVTDGIKALQTGDLETFGRYLFASHASSRDYFKNSCPELDLLVELARSQSGCLGARLTGGGFGGATLNLVESAQVEDFSRQMARQYSQRTGHPLEPLVCQVVDGARVVY